MTNNMFLRNRLANAGNRWQGDAKRVLCVCSAGLLRSPTLAWVLSQEPFNFNTRAAGASADFALVPLDPVLVSWADEIIVMDESQAEAVRKMQADLDEMSRGFDEFSRTPVTVFDVPDNFSFRDPQLVSILFDKALAHFFPEEDESDPL